MGQCKHRRKLQESVCIYQRLSGIPRRAQYALCVFAKRTAGDRGRVYARYPGDACVDILAFDYYNDFNTYPAESDTSFFDHLDQTCQVVSSLAKQHNKLAAISETGVRVMKRMEVITKGFL